MSPKIVCGVSSVLRSWFRLNWHFLSIFTAHGATRRAWAEPEVTVLLSPVTPTEGGVDDAVCCLVQWTSVAPSPGLEIRLHCCLILAYRFLLCCVFKGQQ